MAWLAVNKDGAEFIYDENKQRNNSEIKSFVSGNS